MKIKFHALGFSLIELMIVVSIIGILAAIALPSYQGYTKHARFVEVISSAEPYKIAVALALQNGAALSELSNGKLGIPLESPVTKNLASIKVENGIITATGTELVNSATYILKPNATGNNWTVHGTCVNAGLCEA
ncbi:MAG: prepilin-type N-terminal cleavage/methylation domain-containing protein [Gammaproteobacteria bacterium]|nr:prepilin-type N-terminal cleavage/methylation domain-containing protein [Gammaproteobacteria bacterium]